ncbi:ADP-ribosylation factor-like protein 13B isoform X1 [Macrobrachium rosenbergii]|uniref:ADP-ribosylation factor-like protein 13B isoform X1 n=1 Tax=Macrobrachium rosenbergii TaxID=79674 RepID=UPI0034D3BA1C
MLGLANMGNCLLLLGLKKEKRPVTLLLVGLDNAGKTTAAKGIVGDPVEDVAPTVGFSPENIEYRGCEITIYDLGGGSKIRPVWAKYFSEVHGVIFVVDASAPDRIRECREVLTGLLSHKKIAGKPVLVLANKQDVEGAMDEIDLVESLNVEEIVNKYKCPTRVETCSAITTRKNKPDKPIADGFRWLIDTIVVHYKDINKRVDQDMENERLQMKKELDERKERIRKLRAERERQEALRNEQMARRAQTAVLDDSDDSLQDTTKPSPRAGSSGLPNGTIPQLRRAHAQEEEPEASNSTDAEELKELGFKSRIELQETTSSSSPQASTQSSDSSESPPKGHQVDEKPVEVHKEEDPPSRQSPERHKVKEQTPPPPPKPQSYLSSRISTHLAASNQESSNSSSPSSATKDKDSGILEPNGYAVYYSPSKLDLSNENRKDECVPIDSDDELFDIGSVSSRGRGSAVPFTVRTSSSPSTPSIVSYIKGMVLL